MRRMAILLLVLVVAFAAGCRSFVPRDAPTSKQRAAFGDVAVATAPAGPVTIDRPVVTGWAAGLGMGTVRGIWVILAGAVYAAGAVCGDMKGNDGGLGMAVCFGAAIAGAAVGAAYSPVSIIGGATTAPDGDAVDRAELVLRPLADDPGIADRFQTSFVESARQQAGRTFVDRSAAATLVQLNVLSVESGRSWNWYTYDRPFGIRVRASARVVRAADNMVLWESQRTTGDPPDEGITHTYVEWAADGGCDLRRAIDDALGKLAAGFAESIFVEPPAQPSPWSWLGL